jgi:hypothetical protein
MQHDVGKHRAAAVEAVNAAFEAGRLQGIVEERARVKALIDADFLPVAVPQYRAARASSASRSYGNVITTVRSALRDIGEPVDVRGLAELIGENITEKQTRNALRQMARSGEAVRADRGRFLWRGAHKSPPAEKPGDESPGSVDPFESMAAE